jgi:hypothetical protein
MTFLEKFSTHFTEHCCLLLPIIEILDLKGFAKKWPKIDFFTEIYHIFPENYQ